MCVYIYTFARTFMWLCVCILPSFKGKHEIVNHTRQQFIEK